MTAIALVKDWLILGVIQVNKLVKGFRNFAVVILLWFTAGLESPARILRRTLEKR